MTEDIDIDDIRDEILDAIDEVFGGYGVAVLNVTAKVIFKKDILRFEIEFDPDDLASGDD